MAGSISMQPEAFRFGQPPGAVDIMPGLLGVDFDTAWERRVEIYDDETRAFEYYELSAEDVVATKLASGRPHDLGEVDAIRRAAKATAS